MIPEGEVKLAPQARSAPRAADEAGPHGQQPWLSRDAPYDRMTGMARSGRLRYRPSRCPCPRMIALLSLTCCSIARLLEDSPPE